MILYHNITATNVMSKFHSNIKKLEDKFEVLSSGDRIVKAKNDPANLAVSEKFRAQIKGFQQASRNVQDSISFVQTTEGFLNEASDVLQRIRELSVQASNGTYTDEDRSQINVEMDQLVRELNRIHEDAKFNTIRIFDGKSLGKNSFGKDDNGMIKTARNVNFNTEDQTQGRNGLVAQSGPNTDERMFIEINEFNSYTIGLTGQPEETYGDINQIDNDNLAYREISFFDEIPSSLEASMYLEKAITDSVQRKETGEGIGIDLLVPKEGTRLDITSSEKATETISVLDIALNKLNKERSDLGAYQNRLEMAQRGIDMAMENMQASESRIRDADMAIEFIDMSNYQLKSMASSTMLYEANKIGGIALKIIG